MQTAVHLQYMGIWSNSPYRPCNSGFFLLKSSVLGFLAMPLPVLSVAYLYFLEQAYYGPAEKVWYDYLNHNFEIWFK